jgi:hypothetical protein
MARKALKEKTNMTASKHSQKDELIDPANGIKTRIKTTQPPQNAKPRARKALSSTLDVEASPPIDAEIPSPAVIPSEPEHKTDTKLTEVESPPSWSWDVTGDWSLTCPQLTRMLDLEDSDPQTMIIKLANNPRHSKIGRQLWASFNFGNGHLAGTMRFCPPVESPLRENLDMRGFEKACVLEKGEWVGPPPNGMQK